MQAEEAEKERQAQELEKQREREALALAILNGTADKLELEKREREENEYVQMCSFFILYNIFINCIGSKVDFNFKLLYFIDLTAMKFE